MPGKTRANRKLLGVGGCALKKKKTHTHTHMQQNDQKKAQRKTRSHNEAILTRLQPSRLRQHTKPRKFSKPVYHLFPKGPKAERFVPKPPADSLCPWKFPSTPRCLERAHHLFPTHPSGDAHEEAEHGLLKGWGIGDLVADPPAKSEFHFWGVLWKTQLDFTKS